MRLFFIGDIVGKPGRTCLRDMLPKIKANYQIDITVANCENAAGGAGLTKKVLDELLGYGIDILTSGNHIWDKKEIYDFIDSETKLLRPANYPEGTTPGCGDGLFQVGSCLVGVLNLSGTVFMPYLDCPFGKAAARVEYLRKRTPVIIVDFHAEATSEKISMGWYLDGKVSAVIGTHTHVQTADERVLPAGTAFITDAGMTGAYNSVLGVKKELVSKKFITKLPARFEVENNYPYIINGVIVDIDSSTGKAEAIERFSDFHLMG